MHNLLITHYYPPGFFVVKTSLEAEDWLAQASQLAWERQGAPSPESVCIENPNAWVEILHYAGNEVEVKYYDSAEDIANSYKIEYVSNVFAIAIDCQGMTIFGCCGPLEFRQHQPDYDWGINKRG